MAKKNEPDKGYVPSEEDLKKQDEEVQKRHPSRAGLAPSVAQSEGISVLDAEKKLAENEEAPTADALEATKAEAAEDKSKTTAAKKKT